MLSVCSMPNKKKQHGQPRQSSKAWNFRKALLQHLSPSLFFSLPFSSSSLLFPLSCFFCSLSMRVYIYIYISLSLSLCRSVRSVGRSVGRLSLSLLYVCCSSLSLSLSFFFFFLSLSLSLSLSLCLSFSLSLSILSTYLSLYIYIYRVLRWIRYPEASYKIWC